MSPNFKVTLILLATLAIGIILGAVGRGVIIRSHGRKLETSERTEYFLSRVNDAIDPDSGQRSRVDEITRRAADRISVLFDHHDAEMTTIVDSMRHELAAVLKPEQMERLNREIAVKPSSDTARGRLGIIMAFSYEYAERLQRDLDLDSAQTEQMLILIRQSHSRIRRETEQANGDPEKEREIRRTFLDETNKKIEALLTPHQLEQFRLLQTERERFVEHELREEED
ncbi:MAG TPA: hypothetical protein VMG34_00885 [Bacteroidota bacterium]|nr:hypothetical protein [Bacteroidota bacterium]